MTFQELYQLTNLEREIEEQQNRLSRLHDKATELSSPMNPTCSSSSGGDKIGRLVSEIATLEEIIDRELAEYYHDYVELEMYISHIPDSFTRRIFRMRFIDGVKWKEIAARCGGDYSANSIRMLVERYVKSR